MNSYDKLMDEIDDLVQECGGWENLASNLEGGTDCIQPTSTGSSCGSCYKCWWMAMIALNTWSEKDDKILDELTNSLMKKLKE